MKYLVFLVFFHFFSEVNYVKPPENNNLLITYHTVFRQKKDNTRLTETTTKLYISDSSSIFISKELENVLRLDDSDDYGMDRYEIQRAKDRHSSIKYFVEKKSGYLTFSQEFVRNQFFEYKEDMMSSEIWQINMQDTTTISGLLSYKAECTYGGRKWVAWFSPEISISDGPYKFSGLPGLIVKLESSDGDYRFTLAGLTMQEVKSPKLPKRQLVDKKRFKEMRLTYYENLFPAGTVKGTINGKTYNREETIQFMKEGELNKNYIEID